MAVVAGVAGLVLILILLLEISVRIELSKEAAIDATAVPPASQQKMDVGYVLTLQPTNSSWLQSADPEAATGAVPFLGRKKTSPYGMTASIRRRIAAATNPNLVLAIMASSNWRVVRNSVWLCATLVLVRRQILAATGTSVTALSTLFVGCRAWPLLLFS